MDAERTREYMPASMHPGVRAPRTVDARALVTPFDSQVWDRTRIDRPFRMKYTIELYTPPAKRVYGYYVRPFLLGPGSSPAAISRPIASVAPCWYRTASSSRGRTLPAWLQSWLMSSGRLLLGSSSTGSRWPTAATSPPGCAGVVTR